jgi:transposase
MRLWGCHNLAEVAQALTRKQLVRYLGALPVLVALLERLKVRQIINHSCPTQSPIDHGAVALVLVLNRLMAPRPLYRMVDWLATTLISEYLGVSKDKFNDDRLGRTLDGVVAQLPAIWSDRQQQALRCYRIDLSVVFYDLTALIMTGQYAESIWVDYGFAHNTPADDPKLKLGLTASQDGGIPLLYRLWSGRTADKATVQTNLEHLRQFLQRNGWNAAQTLVVGDCANLNAELAFAYQDAHLRYLAGLGKLEKVHRDLILAPNAADFKRLPLTAKTDPAGYWGVPCAVPFTQHDHTLTQRGLVVLSGPMQQALRQTRQQDLHDLQLALHHIRAKIGQKRYRSQKDLQARIATQLKHSPVGELLQVQLTPTPQGQFTLEWTLDANALEKAQRGDGRYLLVTNDFSLSFPQMLSLYRNKDTVEKRFEVCKQDLQVRPLFVHSDERLQAMLLLNLIALLVYSLLERQAEQLGLGLTTRQMIAKLATLQVQQIEAWDGSQACAWQETVPGQIQLLFTLLHALDEGTAIPLPSGPLTRNLLPAGWPAPVEHALSLPHRSAR